MTRLIPLLFLFGCATTVDLSRPPPIDWPQLTVEVRQVSEDMARKACGNPRMISVYGCAVVFFPIRKCIIFLANNSRETLEHEKLHCLGYDHIGESSMRDGWARHKAILR